MKVLLDTNVVLEHLDVEYRQQTPSKGNLFVSAVTIAEALRLPGLGDAEYLLLEQFFSACSVVPITEQIARQAAIVGRTRKTKIPDLLIAATALILQVPLITKNVKDFRNIPGLDIRSEL